MKDNLGQFVENWSCPFYHPRLVFLWKIVPLYVFWHIWKQTNNILFREESKPEEVVFGIMEKLLKENLGLAKCKIPKEEPNRHEGLVAEKWGCHEDCFLVDNSKMMKR